MINKFIGIGSLIKDVILRQTQNGHSIAKGSALFGRATLMIDAWDDLADQFAPFKKGQMIQVEGEIKNNQFANRAGEKVFQTVINLSKVEEYLDSAVAEVEKQRDFAVPKEHMNAIAEANRPARGIFDPAERMSPPSQIDSQQAIRRPWTPPAEITEGDVPF